MSGKMLFEKLDGLFAAAGLGNHGHIGRSVDDGGNADTHDGVIVDNEDFDFCDFLHDSLFIPPLFVLALFVHRVPPACSSLTPGVKPRRRVSVNSTCCRSRICRRLRRYPRVEGMGMLAASIVTPGLS